MNEDGWIELNLCRECGERLNRPYEEQVCSTCMEIWESDNAENRD